MTIVHVTTLRNALAEAVRSAVNGGASNSSIVMRDGSTTAVTFDLGGTPFGAASSGIITLDGVPISAVASASVTELDNFQLKDGDGTTQITGSITAVGMGGDIEVTNVNVANGQDCSLESLTYEAAA